ncbi:MAG: hypothetical protein F6K35_43360 [Okeania sp. SIO2H7]|nr:hypothetical protein [Okeania sp. SIO2H7]
MLIVKGLAIPFSKIPFDPDRFLKRFHPLAKLVRKSIAFKISQLDLSH